MVVKGNIHVWLGYTKNTKSRNLYGFALATPRCTDFWYRLIYFNNIYVQYVLILNINIVKINKTNFSLIISLLQIISTVNVVWLLKLQTVNLFVISVAHFFMLPKN